ncbi:MAG TPA: serine/threonine-protein kinase, partial [Gemmataceae bacterium]
MTPCPSAEQLQDLLAHRLSEEETLPLEEHIQNCSQCQNTLERLTGGGAGPDQEETSPSSEDDADFLHRLQNLPPTMRRPTESDTEHDSPDSLPCVPGYEVLGVLGRGGMGVVYKARQIKLDRLVALKMMAAGAVRAADRQRFHTEAEVIAHLRHPNIVQIYDVGLHDDRPYFVMEYVEGGTLAQHCAASPLLPPAQAAALVETLAAAIHDAHQHGIAHRDLKPANVLLAMRNAEGDVRKENTAPSFCTLHSTGYIPKISDFGLAKRLGNDAGPTHSGTVLGTPEYMAPEQAVGRGRDAGPAADVYSLGAILYALLTGQPPFRGETPLDTLQRALHHEPLAPRCLRSSVPRDLETICLKCLHKEPAKRYASALDLADDLDRFRRGETIEARPTPLLERLARWCRRRPAQAALATCLPLMLLSLIVVAGVGDWRVRQQRDEAMARSRDAEQARQETADQLRAALLVEARANRRAGAVGRRFDSLKALAQAAALRPGIDLRNEAAACLLLTDLRPERTWEFAASRPLDVAFDASLERYAVSNAQGDINIRGLDDNRERLRLPGFNQPVWALRFSPNGTALAGFGSADLSRANHWIHLWDWTPTESSPRLQRLTGMVFAFHPDGRRLVVGRKDDSIVLHEVADGTEVWQERLAGLRYPNFAFDARGTRLAVASSTARTVWILDAHTGKKVHRVQHSCSVDSIAWHPQDDVLAVASADGGIYLWDVAASRHRDVLRDQPARTKYLTFNAEGDLLAGIGNDKLLRIWDVAGRRCLLQVPASIYPLRFSLDGRRLAFRPGRASMATWRLERGAVCRKLPLAHHPSRRVHSVAFSSDGRRLVSAGNDGVRLWDADCLQLLAFQRDAPMFAVCFRPDGRILRCDGQSGMNSWRVEQERESGSFRLIAESSTDAVPSSRRYSLAVDRDGKTLAAVQDGPPRVLVWRADSPGDKMVLPVSTTSVFLALSPDGRWTAIGKTPTVRIFDSRNGTLAAELPSNQAPVVFSPDGRWLLTDSANVYRAWEVGTWRLGAFRAP